MTSNLVAELREIAQSPYNTDWDDDEKQLALNAAAEIERLTSELTDIRKGVLYHASPLAERDRLRAALDRIIGVTEENGERIQVIAGNSLAFWDAIRAARELARPAVETEGNHG